MALIAAQEINNIDQALVFIPATQDDSYENHPDAVFVVRNIDPSATRDVNFTAIDTSVSDDRGGVIPVGNINDTLAFGEERFFTIHAAYTDPGGIVSPEYPDETNLEVAVIYVKN